MNRRRYTPRLLGSPASRASFAATIASARGQSPSSSQAFPAKARFRAKGRVTHLRAPLPLAVAAVLFAFAFGFAWGVSWAKASAMQAEYERRASE